MELSLALEPIVQAALDEDVGPGDATTLLLFDAEARSEAVLLLKEPGICAGLAVAEAVFRALDRDVSFSARVADGDRLQPGEVAVVSGRTRALLTGERTALNLLGRLSGIATLARRYVDVVEGTGAVILDTRKTTPGLRLAEKYAVRCGGATNHRHGLHDGILVKDNHIRLAGGVRAAVGRLRASPTRLPIEVECDTLAQVEDALAAGADRILLDNMTVEGIRRAVELVGGRASLEASGGVTLDNVRAIAATGVHFISVGALTHSARSLDVSMEVR